MILKFWKHFQQDREHWQTVFFISAAVYVFGNSVFVWFASGTEQSWNKYDQSQSDDPTHSDTMDGGRRVEGKD